MKSNRKVFANMRSSASAGTGKTYNLTGRYIAIALAEGDPSCITALTFTRKSAGEFISEILRRVANGAKDSASAAKLSEEICADASAYTKDDFFALLQKLVSNLNRLKLGTIDAFCSGLINAYAEEFGMFAELSVMPNSELERAQSDALESVFRKNSISQETFTFFAEQLKRATFNLKEKLFTERIFKKIKQAYRAHEEYPELDYWGNPKMFSNIKVENFNEKNYLELIDRLQKLEQKEGLEILGFTKFFARCDAITYPKPTTPIERLAALYRSGNLVANAVIDYKRKQYTISFECADVLCKIFDAILASHLYMSCKATRAVGEIVASFKKEYTQNVVSKGKLVFDDIPTILSSPVHKIEALEMEERLDSKYRHWLFDEFQDTSRLQWRVFENLIDEVIFDGTHERSFYYVGDVKQSIYSWRGGDYRLFSEVFEKYARLNLMSEGKDLVKSYRSVPEIIDYVNAVFDNRNALADVFGEIPANNFLEIYSKHSSAKESQKGYFELKLIEDTKDAKTDSCKTYEEIYNIIKRTMPTSHGKSCAILVRKNDTVQEIIDYIRERAAHDNLSNDISIAGELESEIVKDNMVVPPFLQILKNVSHPMDKISLAYLRMTPYWAFVDGMSDKFIESTMNALLASGYYAFYEKFAEFTLKIAGQGNLDEYSERALIRLGDACRAFDDAGGGEIDEFISYLEGATCRTGTAENTIQVMTIHKSKGLGFDMVILPDIHSTSVRDDTFFGEFYETPFVKPKFRGMILYPQKCICELSEALLDSHTFINNVHRFEGICVFYVALTRAKTAMYVIVPKTKTLNASKELLVSAAKRIATDISDSTYSCGIENWYEDGKVESVNLPTLAPVENLTLPYYAKFKSPSEKDSTSLDEDSATFGTLVHSIFERIKNINDADNINSLVFREATKDEFERAKEVVFKALASKAGQCVFAPKENTEIYTEFPFCVKIGDSLVVGRIDRLEIIKDATGRIDEITLIDFKSNTNNLDDYVEQIASYKQAIAKIFSVDESKIRTMIFGYIDCKFAEI